MRRALALLVALVTVAGCARDGEPASPTAAAAPGDEAPAWIARAVVARVPIDSLTADGTYGAAAAWLPGLRHVGVTVLWVPGVYADAAARPAPGTDDEFRAFVDEAHQRGFHVLLDAPSDSTLSADSLAARLRHAVERFDVDGFRAAHAEATPAGVWHTALADVRDLKPLFLLADGTAPWLRDVGFSALEGPDVARALGGVWGGAPADTLYAAVRREGVGPHLRHVPGGGARPATRAATAVAATLPGFPLLAVNGLDLPSPGATPRGQDFYASLLGLRRTSRALLEGTFEPVAVEAEGVLAYARASGAERVVVVVNARDAPREVVLPEGALGAAMQDVLTAAPASDTLRLEPYGVRLFRGLSNRAAAP